MRSSRYLLFLLLLTCCGPSGSNNSQSSDYKNSFYNTSFIALIPFNERGNLFDKDCKSVNLTQEDFKNIDSLLNKFISDYNLIKEKEFENVNSQRPELKISKSYFIIDLKRYKRQYIAVVNPKGEKEVWINCGCGFSEESWKHSRISVEDGGNCYFNLKINLFKKIVYDFMVNGVA
ncbi:MAG: hypothetical protein WCP85_31450 [Mariniphaga sp.]